HSSEAGALVGTAYEGVRVRAATPEAAPVRSPSPSPSAAPEPPPRTSFPDLRATWLGSAVAAAAFGVLLVPQAVMPGVDWGEVLADRGILVRAFEPLNADSLPAVWGP